MAYLAYLLAGAVSGLCAGLFGIGGGLIIVPVLLFVFTWQGMNAEVVAHVALGTSLATIVITSISSLLAHNKAGGVCWRIVRYMAGGLVLGSLLGAYVAKSIHSDRLQLVIGIGAIAMAIKLLVFQTKEQLGKPKPSGVKLFGAGLGIGGLSAVFGIGGGSLTVPFLTHQGIPMRQAVGTSSACGLPIALAGATGFVLFGQGAITGVAGTVGFVHIGAFVCIALASFFTAKIGAKLAHHLPAKQLKKAFGGLLLLVGLKMAWTGLSLG